MTSSGRQLNDTLASHSDSTCNVQRNSEETERDERRNSSYNFSKVIPFKSLKLNYLQRCNPDGELRAPMERSANQTTPERPAN